MKTFTIFYWAGLVLQIFIRAPFNQMRLKNAKAEQRVSRTEQALLTVMTIGSFFLPLIFSLTGWLDFANYHLPGWMSWLGVFALACGLLVFWRAHVDLKSFWSPSLEIYEGHELMTNGIYGRVRHPMYASQFLFGIAQILLMQNWLAGPGGLIAFLGFYLLRVPAEERMMLDTFGEPYLEYMRRTGRVIPKLFGKEEKTP